MTIAIDIIIALLLYFIAVLSMVLTRYNLNKKKIAINKITAILCILIGLYKTVPVIINIFKIS